jgi:hypothetical protein
MQACKPVVRTARPCFVTVRTVLASGRYRDHRVVLRPVAAVIASGFAGPTITTPKGSAKPTNGAVVGGQTLAPGS